jgi:ferredoxin
MMAYYRHLPPDQLDTVFPCLEGLTIEVTDDCRGCGRCARFCPNQAVRITLTKPDYQEDILRRINDRIDFR